MFGLGVTEIIVIAVVVVLLFGAKRIPELGRSLGGGITEFRKGLSGDENKDESPKEIKQDTESSEKK